jgi:hypothetical protein
MDVKLKAQLRDHLDLYQKAVHDFLNAIVAREESAEYKARDEEEEIIFFLREQGKQGCKAILGLAVSDDLFTRAYMLSELIDFDYKLAQHLIDDSTIESSIYGDIKIKEGEFGRFPGNTAFCLSGLAGVGLAFGNRNHKNGVYGRACRNRGVEQKLAYTLTEWDYEYPRESKLGQQMLDFRSYCYIRLLAQDVNKEYENIEDPRKITRDPSDLLDEAYQSLLSYDQGLEALKAMAESNDLCLAAYSAFMLARSSEHLSFSIKRLNAIAKEESSYDPLVERFDLISCQKAEELLASLVLELL